MIHGFFQMSRIMDQAKTAIQYAAAAFEGRRKRVDALKECSRMPRVLIDNLDDPRIAKYRNLKRTNQTRDDDQFVVEGEKLVERLVTSPFPVASVLATERHAARNRGAIPLEIPFYVVSHDLISVISRLQLSPWGAGLRSARPWPDLADIVGKADSRDDRRLSWLNNPENLGAIVRIGDVFGVDAILVGGSCP